MLVRERETERKKRRRKGGRERRKRKIEKRIKEFWEFKARQGKSR